ncbi:phospholipid scramblase family protein [Bdellovibrio sp. SKB1291214]|uniref:phospholipid scramblase-related protein n=1 Tax=Bdellovibrio sp. SKB1291214 TaxID=1732569 RepID=UPI000B51B6E8|nr:phospholipid scramblase-related protein [Bdellovibrio sp. SKB1291214]UYL08038.1 phospholipid scramblase family protein [Bdellovibrio sp. SKB1291214]
MSLFEALKDQNQLFIRQRKELAELIGFETRNKYEIRNQKGEVVGFCAEQQKGFLGLLVRQFLGHWRSFELHFFNNERQQVFTVKHPFRLFFQRLEVHASGGQYIGALQQRFGIVKKKFDIENAQGRVIMNMQSGFLQFWTFPILKNNREAAVIRKKWSGLLKEAFLDADNFQLEFGQTELDENEKSLILASAIFIDLQYFERKAD